MVQNIKNRISDVNHTLVEVGSEETDPEIDNFIESQKSDIEEVESLNSFCKDVKISPII